MQQIAPMINHSVELHSTIRAFKRLSYDISSKYIEQELQNTGIYSHKKL